MLRTFKTIVSFIVYLWGLFWFSLDIAGRGLAFKELNAMFPDLVEFLSKHREIGFQIAPWVLMFSSVFFLALLQWPWLLHFWRRTPIRSESAELIADASSDDIEKHVEESMPFLFEKLGDLNALIEHDCLTVAQCALLVSAILSSGKPGDISETAAHYLQLALLAVGSGNLNPKHPESMLPYSQYLRMAEAGMFGADGENMPVVNAGWLVPLNEAEAWIQSAGGISVKFDGLKAELVKIGARLASSQITAPRAEKAPAPAQTADPTLLPKSLKDLFNEDFSNCLKFTNQCSISSADGKNKTDVPWNICNDSTAGTKFLSFYIPRSPEAYNVCVALSDFPPQALEHEKTSGVQIISKSPGDASHVAMKDLRFSGRVYLYHEDFLSLTELGGLESLYKSKNLFPQFRGNEYITARWFQENAAAKRR